MFYTANYLVFERLAFISISSDNRLVNLYSFFLYIGWKSQLRYQSQQLDTGLQGINSKLEVQDLLLDPLWRVDLAQHVAARSCWRTFQCRMPCRKHSIEQAWFFGGNKQCCTFYESRFRSSRFYLGCCIYTFLSSPRKLVGSVPPLRCKGSCRCWFLGSLDSMFDFVRCITPVDGERRELGTSKWSFRKKTVIYEQIDRDTLQER